MADISILKAANLKAAQPPTPVQSNELNKFDAKRIKIDAKRIKIRYKTHRSDAKRIERNFCDDYLCSLLPKETLTQCLNILLKEKYLLLFAHAKKKNSDLPPREIPTKITIWKENCKVQVFDLQANNSIDQLRCDL